MATIQIFPTHAGQPPIELFALILQMYKKSCNRVGGKIYAQGKERTHDVLYAIVTCDQSKEFGIAENTLFKFIGGKDALYLVQRAWRSPYTSPERTVEWKQLLESAYVNMEATFVCSDGILADDLCPPGINAEMQQVYLNGCNPIGLATVVPDPERTADGTRQLVTAIKLGEPPARDLVPLIGKMVRMVTDIATKDDVIYIPLGIGVEFSQDAEQDFAHALEGIEVVREELIQQGIPQDRITIGYNPDCLMYPRETSTVPNSSNHRD